MKRIAARIPAALFIAILSFSVLFPLVMCISVSLQTMDEVYAANPVIVPTGDDTLRTALPSRWLR